MFLGIVGFIKILFSVSITICKGLNPRKLTRTMVGMPAPDVFIFTNVPQFDVWCCLKDKIEYYDGQLNENKFYNIALIPL